MRAKITRANEYAAQIIQVLSQVVALHDGPDRRGLVGALCKSIKDPATESIALAALAEISIPEIDGMRIHETFLRGPIGPQLLNAAWY